MMLVLQSILLFATFATSQAAQAVGCGNIQEMSGQVEVLRVTPGEETQENPSRKAIMATQGFALDCTDIVVTQKGARALLKMHQATLSMSSNSRISVLSYSKKSGNVDMLNLTYGKLRIFFKKDEANQDKKDTTSFKVKTLTAVAGVRGTDFFTVYDPEARMTEQATLQGKVEVVQRGTEQKVLVEPGKQVSVPSVPGAQEAAPATQEVAVAKEDTHAKELLEKKLELKIEKPVEIVKEDAKKSEDDTVAKVAALTVVEIAPRVVDEIKHTSAIAKNEAVFATPEAVKIVGKPETWIPEREDVPEKLKKHKNEF